MKGADDNPDARAAMAGVVSINNRHLCGDLAGIGVSHAKTNIGGQLNDTTLLAPLAGPSGTAGEHVASMRNALDTLKSVKQSSGVDACDGTFHVVHDNIMPILYSKL